MTGLIRTPNSDFTNDRLPTIYYPNEGLQALYLMSEPILNDVIPDSSGNGNNGVGFGVTQDSEGYVFSGSYIATANLQQPEQTFFLIFNQDTTPLGENTFICGGFDETTDFYIRGLTNQFNARIDIGTTSLLRGDIDKTRTQNNWVFAAVSCRAGNQEMILPQAGFAFSDTQPPDGTIGATTDTFTIGWDSAGTASIPRFTGKVATVGLYDRYMTQRELYDLYLVARDQLSERGINLNFII